MMDANPLLGVILHATGGLAAASFYILKKISNRFSTLLLLCLFGFEGGINCSAQGSEALDFNCLKDNFVSPDSHSGVNCWWWWLNGNVNRAAIAKDLEAMKSRRFQGAMIFDTGGHNQRGNKDIPKGPLFGSNEWNELFVFAMDEAKRLGLEMGFNIQSGWNLGGPRVTPQYTAKQITFSSGNITGGSSIKQKLELPKTRRDHYEDIAVLAFPIKEENEKSELITDLSLKLGFRELGGSAPDCRFLLGNIPKNRNQSTTVRGRTSAIVTYIELYNIYLYQIFA